MHETPIDDSSMNSGRHRQSHLAVPLAHLRERLARLFALQAPITDERTLTSRLLNGLHLASLPVLLSIVAVHVALGKGLMEAENLTLIALIAVNLLAALLLRLGRVNVSGFVLTYALWAAGVFNMWMSFGFQNIASVFPLLAVLIACLVLPWIAGVLLTVLSFGSLWLYLLLHGLRGPSAPNLVEIGFASTAVFILVGIVALASGQILRRAVRQTVAAQQALSKSEKQLHDILETAPDIIYRLDPEGRITFVNEAVRRYGYDPAKMIRTPFRDYLHPQDRDLATHRLDERRKGELRTTSLEVRLLTSWGEQRVLECSVISVQRVPAVLLQAEGLHEGGPGPEHHTGIQGIARDITDRRRLESQFQQSQKLEAVGRLAGGIAHDFNNMLAVILGQADLASQALASGDPAHESVQEIQKAAERSAGLTRQLLIFARRQDASPRSLDLNQAIAERLGMLRRLIGENIALKWNPAPSPWPVKIDPAQVDQILINLAVNARDAIADVGALTLSTENRLQEESPHQHGGGEGPREWVILTVTDTGTGMGRESLAHLFEPFFTTKEIGKSTGMGLATVYGIVQNNGGRIEVESQTGKGTSFRIYLPRTHEPAVHAGKAIQTPLARGVLLVEDEPAILKLTRITLQRLGYSVIEAASAKEALALAARHEGPLHLLLTDVIMPEMNGLDLHARIAASNPGIRVIFMSGYSADVFPGKYDGKGDFSFLRKPFSMQQLSSTVRQVLDSDQPATAAKTVTAAPYARFEESSE